MTYRLLCITFILFNICSLAQQPMQNFALNKINYINKKYGITPSNVYKKFNVPKYRHYEGKIGNKFTTLDINIQHINYYLIAYLYNDSLENINGFTGSCQNNVFILKKEEWLFQYGNRYFDRLVLKLMPDLSLKGYAQNDSLKLDIACSFKLKTKETIPLTNVSFSKNSIYKSFPVKLSGDIYFSDTETFLGKEINKKLIEVYDYIGYNEDMQYKPKLFSGIQYLKTVNTYANFCKRKFEIVYKNTVNKAFLKEAHESGHTDEFVNDLHSTILINNGKTLCLQVLCNFADGDTYPYYEISEFQYNIKKLNKPIQQLTKDRLSTIKSNMKKYNFWTDEDEWLLSNPKIAFVLEKGFIIKKYGGNHGIQPFYRYIPNRFLATIN